MGPKDKVSNLQMSYSHPSSLAENKAQEADVQAIAELSRALEKKVPVFSSSFILKFCNNQEQIHNNRKTSVQVFRFHVVMIRAYFLYEL